MINGDKRISAIYAFATLQSVAGRRAHRALLWLIAAGMLHVAWAVVKAWRLYRIAVVPMDKYIAALCLIGALLMMASDLLAGDEDEEDE